MRAHRSLSPRQQVLAHIVVGAHDKFVVGTWRKQTQALEYFRFALKAMSNQFFNFGKGRRHNVPMRWRKRNEWQLKQAFKRRQIVTHVTVGRQDHRRGKGLREIEYECALGSRSLASRAEYRVKKLAKAMKESLIESDFSRTELLAFLEMGLD